MSHPHILCPIACHRLDLQGTQKWCVWVCEEIEDNYKKLLLLQEAAEQGQEAQEAVGPRRCVSSTTTFRRWDPQDAVRPKPDRESMTLVFSSGELASA